MNPMINSKEDYLDYVKLDRARSNRPDGNIINLIFYSESYLIQRYLKSLRKLEYLTNKSNRTIFDKIAYVFTFYRYRKLGFKMLISIPVNVMGPGISINHIGNITINAKAVIGKNCTLQPGVVIGQKDSVENVPTIGDHVYLGPGAKVIGKVTIGNNVFVAPNAVVVKDVPDNCVVAGIPAKIIIQNGVRI